MLGCNVQDIPDGLVEVGFSAADIGDMLGDVLFRYGKQFDAIEFMCGDNAYVNGALCDLIEAYLSRCDILRCVPLVGCASHRLNLAVQKLYAEDTQYYTVVQNVTELMIDLRKQKNRLLLFGVTTLSPILACVTRWGSTLLMCRRAEALLPLLCRAGFGSITMAKVEAVRGNEGKLAELVKKLKNCESVSKFLQQQDSGVVTLRRTRVLFDGLIRDDACLNSHLARSAPVVHNPSFEAAIIKIQRGEESKLTADERHSVAHFLLTEQPHEDRGSITSDDEGEEEETSYAVSLIEEDDEKVRKKQKIIASRYKSTLHVSPTSNICERAFSRAKLIMTPQRRSMDPSTLDGLMFLRYNSDMWKDIDVEYILRDLKAVADAALVARRSAASNSSPFSPISLESETL